MSRLSVIIPAHDEAEELPATLACLQQGLAGLDCEHEVLVVDNASTDATAAVALEHGACLVAEPWRQISRVRNTGARQARGDYLLFVDADTRPPAELLRRALAQLEAGACGGGALVAMDRLPHRIYWWGLRMWNRLATRLSLAAGCFVFARREAFTAVGGFDERYYAGDEVLISRRLLRWGRAHGRPFVIIAQPPVVTSGRKADWFSPLQHLLIILIVFLCPLSLRSRRLMWFWYRRPQR